MADVVWPGRLLVPADAKLSPIAFNESGGQAFDDSEMIVGNTPGRWKLVLKNIYLSSPQQILAWQGIDAQLGGRFGTVLMPVFEYPRAPWPVVRGKQIVNPGGLPFSDGTLFSDGSGFAQPVIDVYAGAAIAPGSVTAQLVLRAGAPLAAGMTFSHDATERAYRIAKVLGVDVSGAYPVYSIKFKLPCREAIAAGDPLNFADPKLRCRLDSDDAMSLPDGLQLWRHAAPALTFWEDNGSAG